MEYARELKTDGKEGRAVTEAELTTCSNRCGFEGVWAVFKDTS